MKYITCEYCGCHLDHGEKCDCQNRNGGVENGKVSADSNRAAKVYESK